MSASGFKTSCSAAFFQSRGWNGTNPPGLTRAALAGLSMFVAMAILPVTARADNDPTIVSAIANMTTRVMVINGVNLTNGNRPTVVKLSGVTLPVTSASTTQIIATLPASIGAGSYHLGIKPGDDSERGLDVTIGATGLTGPQGPKGDDGATGPQGVAGLQGPMGPMGVMGPSGATGAQGAVGPQGAKGDTGAQGPAGPVNLPTCNSAGTLLQSDGSSLRCAANVVTYLAYTAFSPDTGDSISCLANFYGQILNFCGSPKNISFPLFMNQTPSSKTVTVQASKDNYPLTTAIACTITALSPNGYFNYGSITLNTQSLSGSATFIYKPGFLPQLTCSLPNNETIYSISYTP